MITPIPGISPMRAIFQIILSAALTVVAHAEFRTWTNSEGQVATLKLVAVSEVNGEKVGEFKMRDGKSITRKESDLCAADAKALQAWTAEVEDEAETPSVFDRVLKGNVVSLDGGRLKRLKDFEKPKKYYAFYYTASWCGPCLQYTPQLVKWYQENKNENFEIVLISSDRSEEAMEGYAKAKKMPWPHLMISKTKRFHEQFQHGVRGIPSLIVCDVKGENLGDYRSRLYELTEMVK